MRQLEAALKAVADPTRTRILKLLEAGELCVCQIQAVLRFAPSTVSKHLSILKAAGLVDDRREGRWIYYTLTREARNPHAEAVLGVVRGALQRDSRIVEDKRLLREVSRMSLSDVTAWIPLDRVARAHARRPGRRSEVRR